MATPKLRFKEFDGDWTSSDFSKASVQIIDGDRGFNYPKSDDFYDDEFCLFLNAGNVTKQGFNFENTQFITKNKDSSLRKGKLERNDLVITTRGTVGNVAYFNDSVSFKNMRINSGMVIARCQKNVLVDFVNQFLNSDLFEKWLDKNAFGSAQPQLTVKLLNSIDLNYPSKPEQTKIASFLSNVDEKISQLTQKHELLNQYKQGMMQKLFSQQIRFKADDGSEFGEWGKSYIGNECRITTGNKDTQNKIDDGSYPFFVRSQTVERINSYSMDCEAILTSGDGVGVGKNYHYVNGKFDFHQRVYCLYDFSEKLIGKYLYIYFSNYFYDRVKRLSAKNSVDSVRMDMISKMEIKLPCLEEQTKIANFLSAIDQKIEVVAQQIEQAKQWKKGLLQQMFV